MPLDIPLVPVNYEAKTFAANALVQAINNLHLAQNSGGGGGGGGAASSEAQKKAQQEDAAAKEQARKDAAASQTDKRKLLEQNGTARKTGLQMEEGNAPAPAAPTITPPAPAAAPSQGVTPGQPTAPTFRVSPLGGGELMGPPPGGGVSGITGTTDQYGNAIPVREFTGSTGEFSAAPATSAEDDIFGWGGF